MSYAAKEAQGSRRENTTISELARMRLIGTKNNDDGTNRPCIGTIAKDYVHCSFSFSFSFNGRPKRFNAFLVVWIVSLTKYKIACHFFIYSTH